MIDNSYPFLKSWPYPYLKRITASGVFREPPLRLYINPYIMQFLYLYHRYNSLVLQYDSKYMLIVAIDKTSYFGHLLPQVDVF